jgi:hypothetical protein
LGLEGGEGCVGKQKSLTDLGKVIYIEQNYNLYDFVKVGIFLFLWLLIGTLLIYYMLPYQNNYLFIPFSFGIMMIISLLLSLKKKFITVYERGVNFPPSLFSMLRKPKYFHCEDIKSISIDKEKHSLIIKLKSGNVYNYDSSLSYYKTDQLFPIVKRAFKEQKHIEFIE